MKKLLAGAALLLSLQTGMAQSLEKMQWFNEPEQWEIKDKTLSLFVTPQSDYWRISHYGFTVDDAPFYYATYGGEFEAKVKITGDYQARFDQAGIMIRIDHKNYIKAGIEFVDGKYNLSTDCHPQYIRLECHHPGKSRSLYLDQSGQTARCGGNLLFIR